MDDTILQLSTSPAGLSLRAKVIGGHFRIGEERKVRKGLRNNGRFLGVSVVFQVSVFNP